VIFTYNYTDVLNYLTSCGLQCMTASKVTATLRHYQIYTL